MLITSYGNNKSQCVLNYGHGSWYPCGQARLLNSLEENFEGDALLFQSISLLGCPTHDKVPYAFKPFAFKTASEMGYRYVLWCDSSVWALKSLENVFNQIVTFGYIFLLNNCTGVWTSDACLNSFGISRDAAMSIPMLLGGCIGLDTQNEKAKQFIADWCEKALDGTSFQGAWNNYNRQVSSDPRCKGHRHDQSVASLLAHTLKMTCVDGTKEFFKYWEPSIDRKNPSVSLTACGMPETDELTKWKNE